MAGDTGIEPVYDGIKIRCLTGLANLQLTYFTLRRYSSGSTRPS